MPRKMKESGVEWLGQIPEGWEVCRVKDSFAYQKGLNITKADLVDRGIFVISYGQIHSKTNTGTYIGDGLLRFVPESFLESNAECLLKKNDFVFADTSEDLDGLGNCAFCDRDDVIFAGYHTIVLRPTQTQEWKYCAYLFKTDAWRSQFRSLAFGIKVFSLSQRLLNVCTFVLPPLPEQERIAAFLDERCAKIDGMIAEAKASVEDYKKWKQSIIFEAVTGKREKNLKSSGIEWVGDIPAEWNVIANKYVMRKRKDICEHWDGEDVLSLSINGVIVRDLEHPTGKMPTTFDGYQYVKAGDALMCLFDYDVTPRCIGRAVCDGVTSPAYSRYEILPNADLNFVYYYYLMVDDGKRILHLARNLRHAFNEEDFGLIKMPLPPLPEQRRIAAELDEKCAAIDKLVGEKESLIADLGAYKKSLIFEAVTGKREVA